jgi:hypothetical protein
VQSLIAGFELQAVDGAAPTCSDSVVDHCVNFDDQRAADLKYVGSTSDAPQLTANDQDPFQDGYVYFSVTAQKPWRTPSGIQEFDIYIDGDGDGVADSVVFNGRLPDTDVLVSELYDLNSGEVVDAELINGVFGDTDTALLNSDTMVLPVWLAALPGIDADHTRINYGVASYSAYSSGPVDVIGMDDDGNLVNPLSTDVLHPGVSVAGSYTGADSPLLFPDSNASVLKLARDPSAYAADKGKGALLVHFQNAVGSKAQPVKLTSAATIGLRLAPTKAARGQKVTATVTVPKDAGPGATGDVTLAAGGTTLATGTATDGTATLTFSSAKAGKLPVVATYAGDDNYEPGTSDPVTLTVAKSKSTVKLTVKPKRFKHKKKARATIVVKKIAGIAATGTVKLTAGKKVLGKGKLKAGKVTITFTSKKKGKLKLKAKYAGDSNYLAGTSKGVTVRVK